MPEVVNPAASLQAELDKLAKYVDASDLVVGIHLNRPGVHHMGDLVMPTSIRQLWFYGAVDTQQTTWLLLGDMLHPDAHWTEFRHPGA